MRCASRPRARGNGRAARVANTAIGAISFLALEAIGGTITLNYGFSQRHRRHPRRRRHHLPDRPADRLLRREVRRRHRPAHPRRRLRLYRLDHHLADLRLVHVPVLRHRSGDHVARAGDVLRHSAVRSAISSARWSSSRWSRTASPSSAASSCGRSRSGSSCTSCRSSSSPAPTRIRSRTGRNFAGEHGDAGGHLNLLLFGTAATVVFSLIAQIGEQVDFLRFLPRDRRNLAHVAGGPRCCPPAPAGSCPACSRCWRARSSRSSRSAMASPASRPPSRRRCISVAFQYVLSSPELALAFTGAFVIISQLKINVTNAYAGSIAWSNFFSRLTHSHPGRVVWLVFNVTIALLLMELGIFKVLEQILASIRSSRSPGSARWSPISSSTSRSA